MAPPRCKQNRDSGFIDNMVDPSQMFLGSLPLPWWMATFVVVAGRLLFRTDFKKVRPVQVVDSMDQPIFFIHGEDDPVIRSGETRELYDASNNEEDRIWVVPGVGHVSVYPRMPEAYVRRVTSFFRRHIGLIS